MTHETTHEALSAAESDKSQSEPSDKLADEYDHDEPIEIPVVKRMVFKFGKPKKKVFYI